MAGLTTLLSCCRPDGAVSTRNETFSAYTVICDKPRPTKPPRISDSNAAQRDIINNAIEILRDAEKYGTELEAQLNDLVVSTSWTEWIAENILAGIKAALRDGREKMGQAMTIAYDEAAKAADELFEFAGDHPVLTAGLITIIAVGILVILAPMIVEALGFAELGPVEGSFAALWESTYSGFIPKGSLFSFLQRLGMVWGRG
ncbi:hypothetical protein PFICI_06178 [Pestalotiopsis fici W106-1]|uniref:Uncharacterized protein n=1 Tax=Pestalotiopsis fici (strain W106-1 / CGMCC3.15140) TaxID=1229662 RepID=W3X7M9_PESFW|nr:uncharacterized protein PFICI_06178 [Pestalotiopsis fici W106-1]ETS81176.1 hypothetical protein PFICI_06178 [Pestalotiopsis fici W106-1]